MRARAARLISWFSVWFGVWFGVVVAAGPRPASGAPADGSLTADEYAKLGIPPADRAWSVAEMIAASRAVAALARERPAQLPRRGSPRSGAVFARLTSAEAFSSLTDRALPLDQRMPLVAGYLPAYSELTKAYVAAFRAKAVGGGELIACSMLGLRFIAVVPAVTDEFLATLDPKDAKYAVRLEGLDKTKVGLAGMAFGALITLGERSSFAARDLGELADCVAATFPAFFGWLKPDGRALLVDKLDQLLQDPAAVDLHGRLAPLVQRLKSRPGRHEGQ
jgi:hypothetical protein